MVGSSSLRIRGVSSVGELLPYKQAVVGSNPASPNFFLSSIDITPAIFHHWHMIDSDIKHISSPILTSKRLILRPFIIDDARALFSWASDPEVTRYLRFETHETIQESQRIINLWMKSAERPPFFHWAMERREDLVVIGSIGIEITSMHDNRGELGYCLTRSAWNQGYATEALRCVLDFGFNVAMFHRLEACHSTNNPASGRVMEKAGMRHEAGPLHHYYRSNALGYQDSMMYVACSDTWQ